MASLCLMSPDCRARDAGIIELVAQLSPLLTQFSAVTEKAARGVCIATFTC